MVRIGLIFLALFAAEVAAEVRVATFNVRNYLVQDRRVEGRWLTNYPKPEKEKEAVQRAIMEMDADILALQEMGPPPFLLELQKDLREKGLDYPYAVILEAEDQDRHLAVLSKIEPETVHRHIDLDFPYGEERIRIKRGLLEVVFPADSDSAKSWSLFVLHLKSRWSQFDWDPGSSSRREKEARAARNRILERYPEGEGLYLIAGDLNAHRNSAPVRRLKSRGSVQISRPVESFDSRGEKWTYFYQKEDRYERVDFLLTSSELTPFVVGGEGVVFDPLYLKEGSDHRPVWLDLRF